jgi:glutamyl-tRNA synthetase
MTVRTRFAPSPTGFLHLGGARTALFNWLEARHRGGQYLVRVEDTDLTRSTPEAVAAIFEGVSWLGLESDEQPIFQTRRFDRYREVAQGLLAAGKAYHCYCSRELLEQMRAEAEARGDKPRYDGRCRHRQGPPPADVTPVIRFRNPDAGEVVVNDRVRGRVVFDNAELDDLIIWRSDDSPTYNFSVVVDDADMRITDVVRGDDHLNNTPRQINLYQALGLPLPSFAHLPMILGPDGTKLSKRHGAVNVMSYREEGFLADAMINYLVRLGWSHGDTEIFSRIELVEHFSIDNVNHSASRFDLDKLRWLNQHYIKTIDPAELAPELAWHLQRAGIDSAGGPALEDVIVALRERAPTLLEMVDKARVWFQPLREYDDQAVSKHLGPAARPVLQQLLAVLEQLSDWQPASIDAQIRGVCEGLGLGLGKVAAPLRVAITGTQVSPSIDHTVYLCGKSEALARIEAALARIPEAG